MPTIHCKCGAAYRFPESAVGRRARCKKCGNEFRLEEDDIGTIPIANDLEPAPVAPPPAIPSGHVIIETEEVSEPLVDRVLPSHGYGQSLLWTVLFPASVRNLVTYVVIVLMIGIGGGLPLIGWIVGVLIALWYAAFRFLVVESAAGGEEDIPSGAFSMDVVDGLVLPMLRWMGSMVVVMAPAVAYVLIRSRTQRDFAGDVSLILLSGPAGLPEIFKLDPTLFVLVCVGLVVWPIVILCVALGGFASLIRFDLILLTLVRSAPAYLVTILIVAAATAAEAAVVATISASLVAGGPRSAGGFIQSMFGMRLVATAATVYLDIVMCRAIGLYYHHFKHKFAWSWG